MYCCVLLDITALLELWTQAFHYTYNSICKIWFHLIAHSTYYISICSTLWQHVQQWSFGFWHAKVQKITLYIFSKKLPVVWRLGIIFLSCCFADNSNQLTPWVISQSAATTGIKVNSLHGYNHSVQPCSSFPHVGVCWDEFSMFRQPWASQLVLSLEEPIMVLSPVFVFVSPL